MKIRKVTKYEFVTEESVTDVEFAPSDHKGCYEVWVNGVLVDQTRKGDRPTEERAQYYFEVHGRALDLEFIESDLLSEAPQQASA